MLMWNRLIIFTLLVLLTACKSIENVSDVKHDFGRLNAQKNYKYYWNTVTDTDFLNFQNALGNSLEFYPDSNPMAERLNQWVEDFHRIYIAYTGLETIPVPKVVIAKRRELNAFVSPIFDCLDVPITFEGSKGTEVGSYLGLLPDGTNFAFGVMPPTCSGREYEPRIQGIILANLTRKFKDCSEVRKTSDKLTLVLKEACFKSHKLKKNYRKYKGFKSLIFMNTANRVVFYDELLKRLPESAIVTVMAHELGHYYLAHPSSTSDVYDIPYRLDKEHNLKSKPTPLPPNDNLWGLVKKLDAIRNFPNKAERISPAPVPGQKYHSWIYGFLSEQTDLISESKGVQSAECKSLFAILHTSDAVMQKFPKNPIPLNPSSLPLYQKYEGLMEACLKSVPYKPEIVELAIQEVVLLRDLNLSSSNFATLFDFVSELNTVLPTIIETHNRKIAELYKLADRERLGHYTTEQEADEFALELLARAGLKASSVAQFYLSAEKIFSEAKAELYDISQIPPSLEPSIDCQTAYDNNFRNFIPVEDYGNSSHHGSCFRVYNLDREYKAHSAELAKIKPIRFETLIDNVAWTTLQKSLKQTPLTNINPLPGPVDKPEPAPAPGTPPPASLRAIRDFVR